MIEIWKDIDGHEAYQISSFGNVQRNARKVIVVSKKTGLKSLRTIKSGPSKIFDNGRGYKMMFSCSDGNRSCLYIHRIVASHFLPNPHNYLEVNHIDGNKSNNHVNNLEWSTREMNRLHAIKNNLVAHGERSGTNKLSKSQVIDILNKHHKNPSLNKTELSKEYGVGDVCIHNIITGKKWRREYEEFHYKLNDI